MLMRTEPVINYCWRQGMMGCGQAHYDGIVALMR